MVDVFPDYYGHFRCLAGACPDTCCQDWQIELDEPTLSRYRTVPGALGKTIRENLITEDGQTRFRLTDGHCALLTEDGLCAVQLACGEEGLCQTCRAHPRFIEEYGDVRELSLSVSCPACAALLLQREKPILFLRCKSRSDEASYRLHSRAYPLLRSARAAAIRLAQDRRFSLSERLALILCLAQREQELLDAGKYETGRRLLSLFSQKQWLLDRLSVQRRRGRRPGAFFPCWMILNNMEHLTDRFPAMLSRVFLAPETPFSNAAFSAQFENLLVYFLFRYFLKAVNDGQLSCRVQSCVFHLLCLSRICAAEKAETPEALGAIVSLYSREVEHSEENLRLLNRVFQKGTLDDAYLLSLLDL